MPDAKTPAELPGHPVGRIFENLVAVDIIPAMRRANHQCAVDVQIDFRAVTVSEKGIALFGKKTTESQMEIRIATRITPPSE